MNNLYRNLLLAAALMPIQIVPNQDPITIKLSDGRIVPYGPGVICDKECTELILPSEDRKKWLLLIPITGIITCVVLCRSSHTPITPTNSTSPNPVSQISEPTNLALMGTGLLLLVMLLSRKRT